MDAVLAGIRLELDLIFLAERGSDLERIDAVETDSVPKERLVGRQVRRRQPVDLNGRQDDLANLLLQFTSFHGRVLYQKRDRYGGSVGCRPIRRCAAISDMINRIGAQPTTSQILTILSKKRLLTLRTLRLCVGTKCRDLHKQEQGRNPEKARQSRRKMPIEVRRTAQRKDIDKRH